jgi:hypothetical protein
MFKLAACILALSLAASAAHRPSSAGQFTGSRPADRWNLGEDMPKMQLSLLDQVCSATPCTPQRQQWTALKQAIPADQRF